MRRGCPPNWLDNDEPLRLTDLLEITESGLPTAWVPRASVLHKLVAAPANTRIKVFADYRVEIIEDCQAVLADVTSPELTDLVAALNEALSVAASEQLIAAQALAASVVDTALRRAFQPARVVGFYKRVKSEIMARHENAAIAELRWGLVHVPVAAALEVFDPAKDPVPAKLNRHACAYAVGQVQYTPANAVIAGALATSLVRGPPGDR